MLPRREDLERLPFSFFNKKGKGEAGGGDGSGGGPPPAVVWKFNEADVKWNEANVKWNEAGA